MNNHSLKQYSSLPVVLFFTGLQIYGLLFLNWSGLYILYLYLIELFFLFGYTIIRFWQLIHIIDAEHWKNYSILRMKKYQLNHAMIALIVFRTLTLLWYLILIGILAVPYEKNKMSEGITSSQKFFENLVITDPLFLIAVFLIVLYYIKKLLSPPDTSLSGILVFSFNLDPLDARFIAPNFALMTMPVVFMLYLWLHEEAIIRSNLYLFAIWLLFTRVVIDIYTRHRMSKEITARGL